MQNFEKTKIAIRYWLLGNKFFNAAKAMSFAESKHIGLRKDGITPEFQHQVSQANFARTLINSFQFPEETLITIWLHDVCEDYNVSINEIDKMFGSVVAHSVELMTNNVNGVKKDTAHYYNAMQFDPIASLCKGVDRMHNHQTMHGVFNFAKQLSYIDETKTYIIPMLKNARRNFPRQESAYENIKHSLQIQIELIENMLSSTKE